MSRGRSGGRVGRRNVAGRYELVSPLGHDALGLVWAGTDLLLRRDVLVREVMAGDQLPPEERASFQRQVAREARAVSRINHPGIVTLLNVVEEPGRTFVITERGEGRTLDRVVAEDGPLHPSDVASIGRQLLSALAAAHRKGIVHRDVRPGTILLLEDGRAKLTDFAVVAPVGGASDPAFTPPDEIGADDGGAEADFWGLGATLFFAVEGEPPYGPQGPGPDWPDQPLRIFGAGLLAPILQALLSGNPEDRGGLGEMQDRLEAI
jgi:serine/threonine protein kinase